MAGIPANSLYKKRLCQYACLCVTQLTLKTQSVAFFRCRGLFSFPAGFRIPRRAPSGSQEILSGLLRERAVLLEIGEVNVAAVEALGEEVSESEIDGILDDLPVFF